MQTIKIELEDHIYKRVIDSGVNLQEKFKEMIYDFLDDGYPAITTEEARKRVAKAVKDVRGGSAILLTQEEYDKDMDKFLKSL